MTTRTQAPGYLILLILTAGLVFDPAVARSQDANSAAAASPSVESDEGESFLGDTLGWYDSDWNFYDPPLLRYEDDTRIYRSWVLGRLWVDAEVLGWTPKQTYLQPLVTTSPAGTPADQAGVLGVGGASVLFGDRNVEGLMNAGVRFTAGLWTSFDQERGLELSFLGFGEQGVGYNSQIDNPAILARPYINSTNGLDAASLISYPGLQSGSLQATSNMKFTSGEALWRNVFRSDESSRYSWVAGYRYARLADKVSVNSTFTSLDAGSGYPVTDLVSTSDYFSTGNDFHGGELGLTGRWWRGRWAVQALGKLGVGATRTQAKVNGQTQQYELNGSGQYALVNTQAAGMLALPSNSGMFTQSNGSILTEFGVRAEYAWSPLLKFTVGYTYMYWTDVARVTDSINLMVDPAQLPPGAGAGMSPLFQFQSSDFWVHGVTASIHYDF